jgi:hypothetical protein
MPTAVEFGIGDGSHAHGTGGGLTFDVQTGGHPTSGGGGAGFTFDSLTTTGGAGGGGGAGITIDVVGQPGHFGHDGLLPAI